MTKDDCIRLICHCWQPVLEETPEKKYIETDKRKCRHCEIVQVKMLVGDSGSVSAYWVDETPPCCKHL